MCELEVYTKRPESSPKVASEVIYAATEGNALIVKDILGSKKKFEGTIISKLDINHETMELRESPILGPVLEFISLYDEYLSSSKYEQDVEDHWQEVKARGDQMVRDLWTKFKKAKAS